MAADPPSSGPPLTAANERLDRQLRFLAELDRLKSVLRVTRVSAAGRRENSAEHSWHMATMLPLLDELAAEPVDLLHTLKMALIHDVVEIDAGDTFAFDPDGYRDKEERERRAAERLFGLLPDDQAEELRRLWEEFEAGLTPEARLANAVDCLSGVIQNHLDEGGTWLEHDVPREAVLARQEPIREALPALWPWVVGVVDRWVT